MIGWLVNDCLTCIPGTKTFWHDLLDSVPGLLDKTNGFTKFQALADFIERSLKQEKKPNYIIRNASYFRRIKTDVPQISLLQDILKDQRMQIDVCNHSVVTVYNSPYTASLYSGKIKGRTEVIPLGIDFEFFQPSKCDKYDADVIFIGSSLNHPKGFDRVLDLIEKSDWTFNLVMKDGFRVDNPRVRCFNRIPHEELIDVINSSRVAVCTSRAETLHLAGVECGACNLPVVATNVGIYYGLSDGKWGLKRDRDIYEGVEYCLKHLDQFSPREFWRGHGLEKSHGMGRWKQLVSQVAR